MGGWQDDNWGRNWEAWKSSSWDWEAWESPDRPSSWHFEAWKSQDWTSQDSQEAWKSQCSSSNDEAWKSQSSQTSKAWKSRGDDDEEESLNSHQRPSGSGTTSKARQERRKNKQWAALEKKAQEHVPDNLEDMQAHLEQMEKAKSKMESRLAELQHEGQQGLGKASEQQGLGKASSSSSSSSSSRNRSTSKSSQNKNKKKKMSTVEEEPEEVPDWDEDTAVEEKEDQLGKADDSTSDASRSAVLSKRGKLGARSSGEEPGEKPKIVLKPRRPTVQIDFHNCLEKQGSVPKAHWQALLALEKACDYYICSYVTRKSREDEVERHLLDVQKEMQRADPEAKRLKAVYVYEKTGELGKASVAYTNDADYIIDDAWRVIKECVDWEVTKVAFAVQTPEQDHHRFRGVPKVEVVKDIVQAVNRILDLEK